MPRLFIVDPNLKSLHGHYFGYATRVGRAAESLGVQAVILGSRDLDLPTVTPPVLPSFSNDYWHELQPAPSEDPFMHLARAAGEFARELKAGLDAWHATEEDAMFLPYANVVEVQGVGQLAAVVGDKLPRVSFLFRRELDEQGLDAGLGPRGIGTLLRQALGVLRAHPAAARVRIFTDSEILTEDYSERLQIRVQTAPIPVDERFTALAHPRSSSPVVVSYFGDARAEKGYHRLPAVAARLAAALECGDLRFVVQSHFNIAGGEPGMAAARQALAGQRGIELLHQPLHDDEYALYLGESHLVLLPYDADRYVARTSGILAEAIHAGVPVVVPAHTWLSDQLQAHGAGVTFDADRPGAFEAAVERALSELPDLQARATQRRRRFVTFHNPDRLARFACGAAVIESGRLSLEAEADV
jgi:glycosyltransferase involved in cell wall biosynthesis